MTSVCLFHAGIPLISGGFVGVDIFFVISGYLIGGIIYRDVVAGQFSFANFYSRRARRILPALFALLAVTSVLALSMLAPLELVRFAKSAISAALAMSNVWFWIGTGYFSPAAELNPLLMTWTLGVEEQFYLLVPALILVLYKVAPRRLFSVTAVLSAISFLICLWATSRFPAASFYLLPTRAWELAAGMLLAVFELRYAGAAIALRFRLGNVLSVIGFAMIMFSVIGYNSYTVFPGVAALLPVAGSAMVIAARGSMLNSLMLSPAPVVFVGRISYSWYLWHWPFLSFARIASDGQFGIGKAVVILAVSFVVAVISWKYIEQPFRYIRAPSRSTLRAYATATIAIAFMAGSLAAAHGLPQRFSPTLAAVERTTLGLSQDSCLVGYGASVPNFDKTCVPADDHRPAVALLGDSHAAALGAALRFEASKNGYDFVQITKASCPPLLGLTRRMPNHPSHERECAAFTNRALKVVFSRSAVETVILAGYWSAPFVEEASGSRFVRVDQTGVYVSPAASRSNLEVGLALTIEALRASHKHVIVALDVPMYQFDPLRHVEAQYIPARRLIRDVLSPNLGIRDWSAPETGLINWRNASAEIPRVVAAKYPDVTTLDLASAFCDGRQCRFADASSVFYIDGQHLSFAGAQRAIRGLRLLGGFSSHRLGRSSLSVTTKSGFRM